MNFVVWSGYQLPLRFLSELNCVDGQQECTGQGFRNSQTRDRRKVVSLVIFDEVRFVH